MQHWNPIPPNLLYFPPKIFIRKNQSIVQLYIVSFKMLIHIIFHSLKSVIGEKSQCKKLRISCSEEDNDM